MIHITAKLHTSFGKSVLALADGDLVGKKFYEGKLQLDLTGNFYNGSKLPEDEIIDLVDSVYIINCVGKLSVGLVERLGLVESERIISVAGIPHAEIVIERS